MPSDDGASDAAEDARLSSSLQHTSEIAHLTSWAMRDLPFLVYRDFFCLASIASGHGLVSEIPLPK